MFYTKELTNICMYSHDSADIWLDDLINETCMLLNQTKIKINIILDKMIYLSIVWQNMTDFYCSLYLLFHLMGLVVVFDWMMQNYR